MWEKRKSIGGDELHGAAPGTGGQRHLAGHFVIILDFDKYCSILFSAF